jgi:hypothetical protein
MKRINRILAVGLAAVATFSLALHAQAPAPAKGVKFAQINPGELREWLTYLASDELQGRAIGTEGYGIAAGYIAENLRKWGVKPIGDNGSYFQIVKQRGYRVTRNSSVTVEVGGKTTTFKHGDHVTFPVAAGGKQTKTFTGVEFIGSAAPAPGTNLKNKLVVFMASAPAGRGRGANPAAAVLDAGAGALIAFAAAPAPPSPAEVALQKAQAALVAAQEAVTAAEQSIRPTGRGGFPGGAGGRGGAVQADMTTVQNVNLPAATPTFTGDETFFEAVLSGGAMKVADLREKASKGEPLSAFSVPNVKVTVNIDNNYELVTQDLYHNVVGMVEGIDPKLKDTYVMYGAHLDHVGYSRTGGGRAGDNTGCRNRSAVAIESVTKAGKTVMKPQAGRGAAPAAAPGRAGGAPLPPQAVVPFEQRDVINNGADDDGSGSTAMLGIAKAYATGPRPARSIVFVWHVGEESGLEGSRYNADFPIVPIEKVQAQLNMDMIGRDDCNNQEDEHSNGVFIVGADRISTDLHNLIIETNGTMIKPLTLDYEMNDPGDPEGVYRRSDHFSYAAKGIPIAFFTTGLHPDYHRVTDTADKILYPKMARIAQLAYQTGFAIAATDKTLERDNKGPRTGFGTPMTVIKK